MKPNEIEKARKLLSQRYPGLTFDLAFSNFLQLDGDEDRFKARFFEKEMDSSTYEVAVSNYRLWYGLCLKFRE